MPRGGTLEKPVRTHSAVSACFTHCIDSLNYSDMC